MRQLRLRPEVSLRATMRQILLMPIPADPGELRRLLGRIDQALERSRYGLRNARQDETAWELIELRKKLRLRRAKLLAKLKEVDYAS